MKHITFLLTLLILPIHIAIADCDLTQFRWECDLTLHIKPTSYASSLVRCGDTIGYVTKANYDQLARYQRADVNMSLNVDDEYVDSPCIPMKR